MIFQNGREKLDSCLLVSRLKRSLIWPPPLSLSAPRSNSLDQVKEYVKSRPWENRLVTFDWSESYQVFPSGPALPPRLPCPLLANCGYGVSARCTLKLVGKPATGI